MLHKKNFALADGTAMAITLTAFSSHLHQPNTYGWGLRFRSAPWEMSGGLLQSCLVWHKRNCLLTLLMIACDTTHGNKEGVLGNMSLNQYAPKGSGLTKQYSKSCPIYQAHNWSGSKGGCQEKESSLFYPLGLFEMNIQAKFIQIKKILPLWTSLVIYVSLQGG